MIGAQGPQMLGMTLPHVAAWNGWHAWSGNTVDGYRAIHAEVDRIAIAAGRDPATVERTMAVLIHLPGSDGAHDPRSLPISGSDEEIAATLRQFAAAGVSHAQVVLSPNTANAIERFAPVLELLDRE
jgi:alkanesulfonate monooxygenase SsuD/methylene tetrahydromethanopterin reductase-like flavin-dependent oxidoreductase (luciferase family)